MPPSHPTGVAGQAVRRGAGGSHTGCGTEGGPSALLLWRSHSRAPGHFFRASSPRCSLRPRACGQPRYVCSRAFRLRCAPLRAVAQVLVLAWVLPWGTGRPLHFHACGLPACASLQRFAAALRFGARSPAETMSGPPAPAVGRSCKSSTPSPRTAAAGGNRLYSDNQRRNPERRNPARWAVCRPSGALGPTVRCPEPPYRVRIHYIRI